jgi:TolA-binding protein
MQEYPVSLKGLDVPIYIAQYYKAKFQPEKMMEAYSDAIAHYRALAQKYANTPLAFIVAKLTSQCQVAMSDWQAALTTLEGMARDFRGKVEMSDIMLEIALINYRQIKDTAAAKKWLNTLINDYPKSRFVKPAQALLKAMEKKQ